MQLENGGNILPYGSVIIEPAGSMLYNIGDMFLNLCAQPPVVTMGSLVQLGKLTKILSLRTDMR